MSILNQHSSQPGTRAEQANKAVAQQWLENLAFLEEIAAGLSGHDVTRGTRAVSCEKQPRF